MDLGDRLVACICEGGAEEAIIDILVDNGRLIFSREQMLDERVLRCRKGKDFERNYLRREYSKPITVLRVLDSPRERFRLSKEYAHQVDVVDIVTSPEIEMLIIHSEGAYTRFENSGKKPSLYCVEDLKLKCVKSYDFVKEYFSDPDKLVSTIKEYTSKAKKRKDKHTLSELIKV